MMFPSSLVVTPGPGLTGQAGLMSRGLVYLCGHLHNLHGLAGRMRARHGSGLREAELADWKDNRRWRLAVVSGKERHLVAIARVVLQVDHGLLHMVERSHHPAAPARPLVVVTWPPGNDFPAGDREPRYLAATASHIRVLVWGMGGQVESVTISVDGGPTQTARPSPAPLYTLAWEAGRYLDTEQHRLVVRVVAGGVASLTTRQFSLQPGPGPALPVLARLALLPHIPALFQVKHFEPK